MKAGKGDGKEKEESLGDFFHKSLANPSCHLASQVARETWRHVWMDVEREGEKCKGKRMTG